MKISANITYKLYAVLFMIVSMTVVACSDDIADISTTTASDSIPITFRAGIGSAAATRAFVPTQDTIIVRHEPVWMYVNKVDGEKHVGAWQMVSNGDGSLIAPDGTKKYYPEGNQDVDVYSIHGNFNVPSNNSNMPDAFHHNVSIDQSKELNYVRSDLLWITDSDQVASTNPVYLKYRHMLSKIEICFQPSGDITDDSIMGAKASVGNVFTNAALDTKNSEGETEGNLGIVNFRFIAVSHDATSFNDANYAEIVIPPQTIEARKLFKVALADGSEFYYKPDQSITFEPGKVYRYHMQLKKTVKITPVIVDNWVRDSVNTSYTINSLDGAPSVSDWNNEEVYIRWKYMQATPTVDDWFYDGTHWEYVRSSPSVDEWGKDSTDIKEVDTDPTVDKWKNDSNAISNVDGNPTVDDWYSRHSDIKDIIGGPVVDDWKYQTNGIYDIVGKPSVDDWKNQKSGISDVTGKPTVDDWKNKQSGITDITGKPTVDDWNYQNGGSYYWGAGDIDKTIKK